MLLESNSDVMHASPAFVLKITGTSDGTGGLDNTNMAAQGMDSKSIANKTYTFSKHGDHFYIYGSAGSLPPIWWIMLMPKLKKRVLAK
jgi:hypothetical protein